MLSHHVLRGVATIVILLLFAARFHTYTSSTGVGGEFARTVLYCCYAFITLLGGAYFSASIVEEKVEQTLPLLRLTGQSPLAILTGKSLPRLLSVLSLLLVIAPFLVLSITLGGVVIRGLATAVLGIVTYAILICHLGLFASVISRNYQEALSRTMVFWVSLEFLPVLAWMGATITMLLSVHGTTANAEDFISRTNLFSSDALQFLLGWMHVKFRWVSAVTEELPLYRNLSLYLADFGAASIWRPQMTFHVTLAAGLLLLSHLIFERATARVVAEGFHAPSGRSQLTRPPKRVRGNALSWKSFRLLAGGWKWVLFCLFGIPISVLAVALAIAWGIGQPLHPSFLAGGWIGVGVVVFICHFAILLDRVFGTEIQQQTFITLLMLPMSRSDLCRKLVSGLVPAIGSSLSCMICGLVLLAVHEPRAGDVFSRVFSSPWCYEIIALLITTFYLGMVLSLRLPHGGMLVAVFCLWLLGPIVVSAVLSLLSLDRQTSYRILQTGLPLVLIVIQIPLCFWLHKLLLGSLDNAGSRL